MARARSNARRTNWIAFGTQGGTAAQVGANSQEDYIVLDPTNAASEMSKYVDPTLVRVRGSIVFDADFSGSAGSQYAHCYCALYVAQEPIDFTVSAGAPAEDAAWSSDRIIWAGAAGAAVFNTVVTSGSDVDYGFSVTQNVQTIDVDARAMRKLGDDLKLILSVMNVPANVAVSNSFMLRCLIKE